MSLFSRTLSVPSTFHRMCNSPLFSYSLNSQFPSVKELLSNDSIDDSAMHPVARDVLRVCLVYFCRVSEVLSLTVSDEIYPDRVLCTGSKGGRAYILFLPGLSSLISSFRGLPPKTRLFPISYSKCYRSCVRAGIKLSLPGSVNYRRMHAGRYRVYDMFLQGCKSDSLSDILHHNSKASLLYYLNKWREPYG